MMQQSLTILNRRPGRSLAALAGASLLALALTGCATPPPQSDSADYQAYQQTNDPLEPTNRVFYNVNDRLDTYLLKPVAQGYVAITTPGIRNHVGDFITNIGEPARTVNFIAEWMPRDAGCSLARFLINSTLGIGGIFDPASAWGLKETDTDFGLTLAIWGLPAGPYLYLPLLGPSGVRDAANLPVEYFATPMAVAPSSTALTDFGYSQTGLHIINARADYLDTIDQIKATALDPYATFRSLYRQSRASEVQQIYLSEGRNPPQWTQPQQ